MIAELHAATLAFPSGRGLRDVSVQLDPGRTVALVGPSGAGKSTLLRLLAGVRAPSAGTVRTLGMSVASLRGLAYRQARDRIGLLEQDDMVAPGLSVLHNVFAGRLGRWSSWRALRNRVVPRRDDMDDAHAILGALELGDHLRANPAELSGGERRRVALARLAFQDPELWLADEPTASLDPRLRRTTLAWMLTRIRTKGASAVIAVHDIELLTCDFDTIWGLRDGRLEFSVAAADRDPTHIEALYEATT